MVWFPFPRACPLAHGPTASGRGSPGTPARIESDDGQDSRHAGLPRTGTVPHPPKPTRAGRQGRLRRTVAAVRCEDATFVFQFCDPQRRLFQTVTKHNTWHLAVTSASSCFLHLDRLQTRDVRASTRTWPKRRLHFPSCVGPAPLPLSPSTSSVLARRPSSRRGRAPLFDRPLDGPDNFSPTTTCRRSVHVWLSGSPVIGQRLRDGIEPESANRVGGRRQNMASRCGSYCVPSGDGDAFQVPSRQNN